MFTDGRIKLDKYVNCTVCLRYFELIVETLDVELPGTRHRNYELKDHIVKNPKSPLIAAGLRLQLCLRGLLGIGIHLLGHDPDADMRQCRLEDHLSLGLVVGELHVEHLVEAQLLHHSCRVVA